MTFFELRPVPRRQRAWPSFSWRRRSRLAAQRSVAAGPRRLDRLGQLSGRPSRRADARRRRRRRLLPRRAASAIRRTSSCSTAPSCRCWSAATSSEAVGFAERIVRSRQERPHRPAGARRARAQAEAIRRRAPRTRPVGARPDHRSRRDAARRLGEYGAGDAKGAVAAIDKLAGPDWYAIFKDLHAGMILDLAGNKNEAGKRFEQAYKLDSYGAARGRGLWQLAVAQRLGQGRARRSSRPSTRCCRDHPLVNEAMEKLNAGQETAAAGGHGAGRRRRSALRARRLARPPRRRGPRPRLSAACALSRAQPSAGAVVARRSLRAAEEAGAGDQGL